MEHMGFKQQWIRGIAALYSTAHSQVLVGGAKGSKFARSGYVRQGCSLAPILYLFLAEAASIYFTAQQTGLQGLALPFSGTHFWT